MVLDIIEERREIVNSLQIIRASFLLLLISLALSGQTQAVTINAGTADQMIDGFGGQTKICAENLMGPNADLFFSPTAGVGCEAL
jgi:O-glycosyl hydrolase